MTVEEIMESLGLMGVTNTSVTPAYEAGALPTKTTKTSGPIRAPHYEQLRRLSENWPIILDGPSSTGKSESVHQLAKECGATLYVQQGHRALSAEELRGSRGLNEKGTIFEPGPLILSLEDPIGWYLGEEFNFNDPGILGVFHNLLDDTGQIMVPELGRAVKVRKNWRCFFTRNAGYAGTVEMNGALESRCVIIETDNFPPETEARIIAENYPASADKTTTILKMAQAVRAARQNGEHEFDMGLRTMFQLLEEWEAVGDPMEAFKRIVLPKIGARDTYAPVREALLEAVRLIIA